MSTRWEAKDKQTNKISSNMFWNQPKNAGGEGTWGSRVTLLTPNNLLRAASPVSPIVKGQEPLSLPTGMGEGLEGHV